MNMESIGKVIAIPCLACLIVAYGDIDTGPVAKSSDPARNRPVLELGESFGFSVQQVSRVVGGYNTDRQPTVSILLGSNNSHLFDVSLLRSNVREGYTVRSHSFNRPEVVLTAGWHGNRFVQSTGHPTYVNLTIRSITPKEAVIYISGTLVNTSTGGFMPLPPSVVRLRGPYLKALLANE